MTEGGFVRPYPPSLSPSGERGQGPVPGSPGGEDAGGLLAVNDLSVSLGGKPILRGVSFSVERGEWVAVAGPNGAGKSTLLRRLARVLPPFAGGGTVLLDGRDLDRLPRRALARDLAFVAQLEEGENPFTVREFVLLGRYPHLSPFTSIGPADREAVAAALAGTGMEGFASRRMDTLSGGERQRAAIAAAIAQSSPFLLLDEPTAHLDPRHQDEVLDLLSRLNRDRGATLLTVTHDLNAAAARARRVLALSDGRVAWFGPAAGLLENTVLSPLFGKRFSFAVHPADGRRVALP
jgi:iron complex transport system ATP-binding protein